MFSRCGPLKVNRAGLSVTLIVAIAARRLFVAPVGAPERKSRGAQRGMHSEHLIFSERREGVSVWLVRGVSMKPPAAG